MVQAEKPLLTDRQKEILSIIERHVADFGRPPTIREIGSKTGISSTSVVSYHLRKLEDAGLIKRKKELSRGISLIGQISLRMGSVVTIRTDAGDLVKGVLAAA